MCGITGIINFSDNLDTFEARLSNRRMSNSIIHRGPDDEGQFYDNKIIIKDHLFYNFKRYLNNREEDEVINRVKKDILMMLYNERHKVQENYKRICENEILCIDYFKE